jgi:kynureninase
VTVGDRDEAARREAADPVASRRDRFVVPSWEGGAEPSWAYFAGNSLGLVPRAAEAALAEVVGQWSTLGVEGWFDASPPWVDYAAGLRAPLAALVGAGVDEVAAMNSLTVNLHLLLASFYRPHGRRDRILI